MANFKVGDMVKIRSVEGLNLIHRGKILNDHPSFTIGNLGTVIREVDSTEGIITILTLNTRVRLSPLRLIFVDQEDIKVIIQERVINKIKLLDKRFKNKTNSKSTTIPLPLGK